MSIQSDDDEDPTYSPSLKDDASQGDHVEGVDSSTVSEDVSSTGEVCRIALILKDIRPGALPLPRMSFLNLSVTKLEDGLKGSYLTTVNTAELVSVLQASAEAVAGKWFQVFNYILHDL